ncbi:MAG: hypothetical protein U1E65_17070 [Myxococcota bacterium]
MKHAPKTSHVLGVLFFLAALLAFSAWVDAGVARDRGESAFNER